MPYRSIQRLSRNLLPPFFIMSFEKRMAGNYAEQEQDGIGWGKPR